ncbi:hypothetical protein CTheo_5567 [Ceratobasidium theobromae]|uniref:Uncharacterized protein n=1 Tax=Ceratobasidium theobromae TaxID=1582974 RepID=A0A5N5QH57_9AGAM|nr:hypothetical protein CTheo_5567 [Ceratobasidium theobromae]
MIVKLSGRTELSVWEFMAWNLPNEFKSPLPPTATNGPRPPRPPRPDDGMIEVDLGGPLSRGLPTPPGAYDIEPFRPLPPLPARRDPFTFSSVSSLLNTTPRDLEIDASRPVASGGRYQLYDTPVPIPIERPPVQRPFERISGYINDGNAKQSVIRPFSMYYAPTPVYDKFARGTMMRGPLNGPAISPTAPLFSPQRNIQRRDGKWGLADELGAIERPPLGEERTLPAKYFSPRARAQVQAQIQEPVAAHTAIVRRPTQPRIAPGSLPNPNINRPNRV